jgi:hypothetical protein
MRIETLESRRLLAAMFFDGGGGSNLWNNPDNWSLHRLPTAQDDVTIGNTFNVVLSGAAAAVRTLSLQDSASLSAGASLTIGANSYAQAGTTLALQPGGTLDGAGDVTLQGTFDWTGGAMRGSGRTLVAFGGHVTVSGADVKELARTLRVEQSAQVGGSQIDFNDGTLEIDPRATMLLNGVQLVDAGGTNRIDNAGQINTAGFLVRVGVPLYHSGAFEIYGNLDLTGGGTATGTFEMFTADKRLLVGGPGYTFGEGARIFGAGAALWFTGGPSIVAEPVELLRLTVSGADVTFNDALTVSGVTHVEASTGALSLAGKVSNLTTIQVETASRINLLGDGTHVLRTTYPGIQETARLDIGREAVIFDYPPGYSSLGDVRFKVRDGYFNGAWTGSGICSEIAGTTGHAIGYGEASALFAQFPATFMGQSVDETSVLVRFTRYGDANLDGTVNLTDFNRLARSFGSSDAYWTQGEFNYDESVTLADFNLLVANFGQAMSTTAEDADEVQALLT